MPDLGSYQVFNSLMSKYCKKLDPSTCVESDLSRHKIVEIKTEEKIGWTISYSRVS
jgi:hypothetical protein